MHFLHDGCALIMSGFTLYNGLSTIEGIVAAYGKDGFARTLIKHDTFNSKNELKNMLQPNRENSVRIKQYNSGPVDFHICVRQNAGVSGLEEYLSTKGFIPSGYENELEAASLLLEKLKGVPPKSRVPVDDIANEISHKGKEIASAITLSHVSLIGRFGCASNQGSRLEYEILMNSPLDMGEMNIRGIADISRGLKRGLVFINGSLRILTSTGNPTEPYNEVIWDIYPKFDSKINAGLMNVLSLDDLIFNFYTLESSRVKINSTQKVLLGCYTELRGG